MEGALTLTRRRRNLLEKRNRSISMFVRTKKRKKGKQTGLAIVYKDISSLTIWRRERRAYTIEA